MYTAQILSMVIVTGAKGHIASLRFSDRLLDIDIAATYKDRLYGLIEDYIRRTPRVDY